MNKALPIIAIVILVGLGIWWFSGDRSSALNTNTNEDTQTEDGTDQSAMTKTSLKALMAAGAPVKCTYNQEIEGEAVEGTAYVSGNKMRVDFSGAAFGTEGSGIAHMVADGQFMYIWSDGMTQGFKMEFSETDLNSSVEADASTPDINEEVDYSCSVWLPTPGSFTPPSNVNFTTSFTGLIGN